MNAELQALVKRIWRRAYLDTEEECAKWIEDYCDKRNKSATLIINPLSHNTTNSKGECLYEEDLNIKQHDKTKTIS